MSRFLLVPLYLTALLSSVLLLFDAMARGEWIHQFVTLALVVVLAVAGVFLPAAVRVGGMP